MAVANPYGKRGNYVYIDDQGQSWGVFMYAAEAQAGGFALAVGPALPKSWPYHRKAMRQVQGVSSSGKRISLPAANTTGVPWNGSPGFTVNYPSGAVTFTTTGYRGERKYFRFLA